MEKEQTIVSKESTFTGDPTKQKLITTKFVVGAGNTNPKNYTKIKPESTVDDVDITHV